MKSFFQFLGTGSGDLSPSSLLFFDQARYLFNCGEGSQRYFIQHQIKFTRLNSIFLTRLSWQHAGGLPGLVLTAADAGADYIRIIGPRYTYRLLAAHRHFVARKNFPVSILEVKGGDSFQLDFLKIKVIELFSSEGHSAGASTSAYFPCEAAKNIVSSMFKPFDFFNPPKEKFDPAASEDRCSIDIEDDKFHVNEKKFRQDVEFLDCPPDGLRRSALCFFVQGPDIPGTFFPDKADKLGVPKLLRSKLVKGEVIMLPDGREVSPEDCVGPNHRGSRILYMDVPDLSFLPSLLEEASNPANHAIFKDTPLDLVVHQINLDVLSNAGYLTWMRSFDPSTRHVFVGSDFSDSRVIFTSSAILANYFFRSNPFDFCSPWFSNVQDNKLPAGLPNDCRIAAPLLQLILGKKSRFDNSFVVPMTDDSVLLPQTKSFLRHPHQFHYNEASSSVPGVDNGPSFDGIILGSGSALPSKYRNVSAIYCHFESYGGVFLDCGEGSYGQFFRAVGPTCLVQKLANLKAIYISHLHADHHLGLVRLLEERKFALERLGLDYTPATIIAPSLFKLFLKEISYIIDLPSYTFISSHKCQNGIDLDDKGTGLVLQTVPVFHVESSFACILKTRHFKLLYTGDTRPCDSLIEPGMHCDLLIHEATFDNESLNEAVKKRHSTWAEAIEVASRMNAKNLLLTHFSQRYHISPTVELEDPSRHVPCIALGTDFMKFSLRNMNRLSAFQSVQVALSKEWENNENNLF